MHSMMERVNELSMTEAIYLDDNVTNPMIKLSKIKLFNFEQWLKLQAPR